MLSGGMNSHLPPEIDTLRGGVGEGQEHKMENNLRTMQLGGCVDTKLWILQLRYREA